MYLSFSGLRPLRQRLRLHDLEQRIPDPQAWYQALRKKRKEGLAGRETDCLYQKRHYARTQKTIWIQGWMRTVTKTQGY